MDLRSSNYLEAPPPFFHSHSHGAVGTRKENPFVDGFPEHLCELNLKSFPMVKRNVVEAPSTPGRPVFSFSVGSRKNFPSKWDNAEKWLVNGHESPAAHASLKSADCMSKQQEKHRQAEVFCDESRVTKPISVFQGPKIVSSDGPFNGASDSSDVLLKDKFTNEVEPSVSKLKCLESMNEGFVFGNSVTKAAMEEAKHRDTGTEMTPIGSSTTSRCPTPLENLSPPRHNTPASRSGSLALMDQSQSSSFDIGDLQEWHLSKLQPGTPFDSITSNWSSREEEEEDISKSLRHFEITNDCLKNISGPRPCAWEEKEQTKSCLRYKIEEAKIQAWVNLQSAKAEAQSRKLEIKIEKMRSKCEEKLMKKMAVVHRKAEELRAAARLEHTEQVQKTAAKANRGSCGCFILN